MRFTSRSAIGFAAASLLVGSGFAIAFAAPSDGVSRAEPDTCTSITTTLGGAQGAAGSLYQTIRFTNTGSVGCMLTGYPGVAYVNVHKILIGYVAAHEAGARAGATPEVVVPPGKTATAVMQIPDYANFRPVDCIHFNAHLIRVAFAGKTTFLHWDNTECTTKFARSFIGPVQAPA